MNIGMTGHCGLIGTLLKRKLEEAGHNIVLSVDLRSGEDIRNLRDKKSEIKIDMMIHAAAHCKINQSISDPQKMFDNNVEGTFAVFEFCRKNNIPKIVYFSSSRVLSKETNPYTVAKLFGEELCKGYKDSYGIDYIIIRPSTVYGPFWDETQRLTHIFITNALEGKDLEIYGHPETKTLDFAYVDDFVDGVMLTLNHGWGKAFDISGEEEFKVYDLAKMIIKKTGSSSDIVVKGAEIAQPQEVNLDISAIRSLGYNPKVSLEEGVGRTIEFYKKYLSNNSN